MKCEELEEQIGSPAMAPAWRERALRHIAACESCARRWSEERSLNERLREFASATEPHRASPRVRQELRAAFAAQHRAANVVSIANQRAERRVWTPARWTLAAAALLVAMAALALLFWPRATAPQAPREQAMTPERLAPAPPALIPNAIADVRPSPLSPKAAPRRATPSVRPTVARAQEQVSEFFPLTLAADDQAIANGTLVRMELPRARLIAMGLPLQYEDSQDTLHADVLLGDNGVAYAIRVVHQDQIAKR